MLIDDCNFSAVVVSTVNHGIRQGGLLSGFLQTVFINDLLDELEHVNENFGTHEINKEDSACSFSNPNSLQYMPYTAYNYS